MPVQLTPQVLAAVELRIKNFEQRKKEQMRRERQALVNRTNTVCTPKIKKWSWKKQLRKRFSSKFVTALDIKSSKRAKNENLMKQATERNDPLQSDL